MFPALAGILLREDDAVVLVVCTMLEYLTVDGTKSIEFTNFERVSGDFSMVCKH